MHSGNDQSLAGLMGIDANGRRERLAYVGFTDEDARALREMLSLARLHADMIVDRFYANISLYPELLEIIRKAGSSIDRLKTTQKRYFLELFEGDYGRSYFERRLRIGLVHNRIGLTPRWYLGGYSVYRQSMIPLIMKKYRLRPRRRARGLAAFNKIISIDSQLAMDTYIHGIMSDLGEVSLSKGDIEARVNDYRDCVARVASGNLSGRLDIRGDDELAQLGLNLNAMMESLAEMAGGIREASQAMFVTLAQVHGAMAAQSTGASEQAAAVNETTATLEQIKATSRQTLEKAQQLGSTAERTRHESEEGLRALGETVAGMEIIRTQVQDIAQTILALSEQTQQIGEITEAVDNLAQQSRMLALNASIEAAKAGEAGKGFAVVAAEVRALAEQSQQSTSQVQRILQDIRHATDRAVLAAEEGTTRVKSGLQLVERSGEVTRRLSDEIRSSALASQQIVAAVRQEAAGIEQVVSAMNDINNVTAQFVASTKETAHAAEELKRVAMRLQDSVQVYKIE